MILNFRPNAFSTKTGSKTTNKILKAKNTLSRGAKVKNIVEKGAKMMKGQTGNQNGEINNNQNSGKQSSDTTISVPVNYYYLVGGQGSKKIVKDVQIKTTKNKVVHIQDSVKKINLQRDKYHL